MYQLVMSTVHVHDEDTKYDADGIVWGIRDLGTALKAAILYQRKLNVELGLNFVHETEWVLDDTSPVFYRASATLIAPNRGTAKVTIEIQRSPERDDPERIVEMMRLNSKFSFPDLYYTES